MKAIWNGATIAESNDTIVIENNHYFPPNSVKQEYLQESKHTTVCSWKGNCNYKHLVVEGKVNENALWYYANPKDAAKEIAGYAAFWKGVEITK